MLTNFKSRVQLGCNFISFFKSYYFLMKYQEEKKFNAYLFPKKIQYASKGKHSAESSDKNIELVTAVSLIFFLK